MGRGDDKTARQENQQNFQVGQQQIGAGSAGIQRGVDEFRNHLNDIFANNPYEDPTYLSNVRSTASAVESGAANKEESELGNYAARTGENSSSIGATADEARRQSTRNVHDILTRSALDDQSKRQQQLMTATAMLGQIPGMYNPMIGAGTSLATGGAGNMTQMAGQGSWFDNLINAGIAAGGTVAAGFAGGKGK